MSGHSKWSKVKHQKATTDVVKAKAFTKASRAITIAVREGGGTTDPDGNFKLRLAIELARAVNMPKDNIERAIAKAAGENGGGLESFLYEGYGPGGTALIIEAASENRQRTVSAVKNTLERNGGVLAAQGAVSYQFERLGIIVIDRPSGKSDDDILLFALESGAQDVAFFDNEIELYTTVSELSAVQKKVESAEYSLQTAGITYRPTMPVSVDDTIGSQVHSLIEALEELDDVQNVHSNLS